MAEGDRCMVSKHVPPLEFDLNAGFGQRGEPDTNFPLQFSPSHVCHCGR